MKPSLRSVGRVVVGVVLLAWVAPAQSAIIVTLDSITPFQTYFDYQYSITATDTDLLRGSNSSDPAYITLYDIPGLITLESWPDWHASGGQTPFGVTPTDDPNLQNATFYYDGAATIAGPAAPLVVGIVRSSYGAAALGTYAWEDLGVDPLFPESRIPQSGLGYVGIPSVTGGDTGTIGGDGSSGGGATQVPEPSALLLLGSGIALLLWRSTRIRRPA
jgi:hypothetical protein